MKWCRYTYLYKYNIYKTRKKREKNTRKIEKKGGQEWTVSSRKGEVHKLREFSVSRKTKRISTPPRLTDIEVSRNSNVRSCEALWWLGYGRGWAGPRRDEGVLVSWGLGKTGGKARSSAKGDGTRPYVERRPIHRLVFARRDAKRLAALSLIIMLWLR